MSRFVIITTDTSFEQRVRAAVAGGLHGNVQRLPESTINGTPQDIVHQDPAEPPEVVILGPGVSTDEALKLATVLDLQFPEVSVILAADATPELVLTAMRSGIRDIVSPGTEASELRILLERACLSAAGRRRGLSNPTNPDYEAGRVIAVMSPKGGVGKTTVATNLATGLGKLTPMGVVIVDLDVQFGDVASALSLHPEHTLVDAVTGAAAHDAMVLKAFLTVHVSGIYALCAPLNPNEADLVTADHISHLIAQLATEFKYVVIDTAPGLGELALAALEQASDVVWVVGMDIPSIKGLRTGFSVLDELNLVPQGRHVVLNFASRHNGLNIQDIEATLRVPVDIVLPLSTSVPFATNKGVPMLQDGPRNAVSKNLRKLVDRFEPIRGTSLKKLHRRVVVS
ncbi:pilus assembly protein CpaE [Arthrobacter psychrolactophilus]|uniref:Pilus assembly protein CpaE n=1 Tax=Arthrobacter psychrolactophilus TaxID=92442 RepID=A0A2V5IQA7_9MICC|nr:AAA family ATPase [Arthrobacter psychrolactophilus]PYI38758.1 pilus assembly protein CpaE [Arthrobacter psychrolactophilus]